MKRYIKAGYVSYPNFLDIVDDVVSEAVDITQDKFGVTIDWGESKSGLKFVFRFRDEQPEVLLSWKELQFDYNNGGVDAIVDDLVWQVKHKDD